MADFTTKANEITTTLDRLITELAAVEDRVGSVSDRFSQLADQASRVEELNTTVGGLRIVLDKLDAPFLAKLEESAMSLNRILESINPRSLETISNAYANQITQLQELIRLQGQFNRELNTVPNEKPRLRIGREGVTAVNQSGVELLQNRASSEPSYLLNAQQAALRAQAQKYAEAYITRNQAAGSLDYAIANKFKIADPRVDVNAPAEQLVRQHINTATNTPTSLYTTQGNKVQGAQGNEAAANQLAIEKAIAASAHKLAIVTTTGTSAGGASLFTQGKAGQTGSDHAIVIHQDEEGNYHSYEMRPGGSLVKSKNQGRRSVAEIAGSADRVEALGINNLTKEQAEAFVQAISSGTEAGRLYSFFTKLGNTCSSIIAEKVREIGLDPKFGKPSVGVNSVTPSNVLDYFAEREGVATGPSPSTIKNAKKQIADTVDDILIAGTKVPTGFAYAANTHRGRRDWNAGEIGELDESLIKRNQVTGRYSTQGNGVAGATPAEAAAIQEAIIRAVNDSKYGVAIAGNTGNNVAGGASKYGILKSEESVDHAFVALRDEVTGFIHIIELLADGTERIERGVNGEAVTVSAQVASRSLQTIATQSDRVEAVPVNFGTREQVQEFLQNLLHSATPGEGTYGLKQVIDPDTGRQIGESCASAIAHAGRDAGLFGKDFGKATAGGSNVVTPSQVINIAEALNERARRVAVAESGTTDISSLQREVSELKHEADAALAEYKQFVEERREALTDLVANDEQFAQELQKFAGDAKVSLSELVDAIAKGPFSRNPELEQTAAYASHVFDINDRLGAGLDDAGLDSLLAKNEGVLQKYSVRQQELNAKTRFQQDREIIASSPTQRSTLVETLFDKALRGIVSFVELVQQALKKFSEALNKTATDIAGVVKNPLQDVISTPAVTPAYLRASAAPTISSAGSSPLQSIQSTAETASKFYRNFQFATSQGGAILNSIIEGVKGAQIGGPSGFLDVSAALIKAVNAIVNLNNKFQLGIVPKGVGELFTQRRSDAIIDIIEIFTGATTGVRQEQKQSVAKDSGISRGKEAAKEDVENEKEKVKKKAQLAAQQQTTQQQTIPPITPEDDILHRQATGAEGPATTPTIEPNLRTVPILRDRVAKFLTEQEKQLSLQTEEAIREFAGTTGFSRGIGSGFAIAGADTIRNIVQAEYGIPKEKTPEGILGISLTGKGGAQGAFGFAAPTPGTDVASTAIHELAHELIDAQIRQGSKLYENIGGARTNREQELLTSTAARTQLYLQSRKLSDPYNQALITDPLRNAEQLKYVFKPEEVFANVSQALISGNKEMQHTLETFYGPGLYKEVVQSLEREIGDVFSPSALSQLQSRYSTFSQNLNTLAPSSAGGPAYLSIGAASNNPLVTLGNVLKDEFRLSSGITARTDQLPQLLGNLGKALTHPAVLGQISKAAVATYIPFNNKSQENLFKSYQERGASQVFSDIQTAIKAPDEQNIRTAVQGFKRVFADIPEALRGYIGTSIKESESVIDKLRIISGVGSLGVGGRSPSAIIPRLAESFLPVDYSLGAEARKEVYKRTGSFITSEESTPQFDANSGRLTSIGYQAKTLNGVMTQLNYSVDAFGRKELITENQRTALDAFKEQVGVQIPRAITDNLVFGALNGLQEMFQKLVSIQDELGEVANLFGAVGKNATQVKTDFLSKSISVASETGQGFQEGVQTNLRNIKTLGAVPDVTKREELANQLSRVQLGSQTVFGISLEQSLESIPSILSSIRDGMDDISDPTERTTAAIAELNDVMDKTVVVQRASGAQGDELITIYSRLAASAKEYGLSSGQLLSLSASSAVSIGKGSDETSNILRSLLEGTYSEANEGAFQKVGISTKVLRGGQLENRGFADVLQDVFKLSQAQDRKVDYQHLLQAIAGPKLAPDFAKVVQGFGTNFERLDKAASGNTQGVFSQTLEVKVKNFGAALNSLEANATKLFNSFLVGTGLFDKFTAALTAIARTADQVGDFFDKNRESVTGFVDFLLPIIKFFTVGTATKGLNVFEFIPKLLGNIETSSRGALAEMFDFFAKGDKGATNLQKNLSFVAQALRLVTEEAQKTGIAVQAVGAAGAQGGTIGPSPLIKPSLASQGALTAEEANLVSLQTTIKTLENVAEAKASAPGLSRRFNESALGRGLAYSGDALGAAAAPIGFDLLTGGFNKENISNIGIGIAGAFAGATVGPMGAALGYTFAKAAAENLDVYGLFGTSQKETSSFAKSIIGKSEADKTPAEREQEKQVASAGLEAFKKRTNYDAIIPDLLKYSAGPFSTSANPNNVSSKRLADYQRLFVNGENNGPLDALKKISFVGDSGPQQLYQALSKNPELLQRFIDANVSSITEYNTLLENASKGKGDEYKALVDEGLAKLNADTTAGAREKVNELAQSEQLLTESVQGVLDRAKGIMDDAANAVNTQYDVSYGLPQFGAFGSVSLAYQQRFQPTLNAINSGKLTGQKADTALQSYDLGYQSVTQLPNSLQQIVPLAQRLGQNTDNLNQLLYRSGSQGQSTFLQQIAPIQEADKFAQQYEAKIAALKSYTTSQLAGDARIRQEYDTLNKTVQAEKTRYEVSKQYLQSLGGQTNLFRDQLGLLQQQTHARRLISAAEPGTPATFQAPSLVNANDYTSAQLTKAISDAREKQAQLVKVNPGYGKYFADQQFVLNNGQQFAGVSGVDQSFFNESLQAQKQQLTPPQTVDLSQYTDTQVQKIISQARAAQDQAVKLAPDLKDKYEGERLLVMRKNNQLLLETGLSQDFLRQAIQDNTKSQDQLRGHYNLPGSYRVPTVFDYYASGGKEVGEVNYPSKTGGQASIELAQQIAQAVLNAGKTPGKEGPDLSQVGGTVAPNNLKYYTGGTPGKPAVYAEEPVLPDLPNLDDLLADLNKRVDQTPPLPDASDNKGLTKARENYVNLKQRQLDELEAKLDRRPIQYTDPSHVKSMEANKKGWENPTGPLWDSNAATNVNGPNWKGLNDALDEAGNKYKDSSQKVSDFNTSLDTTKGNVNTFGSDLSSLGAGISNSWNAVTTNAQSAGSSIASFASDISGLSNAFNNLQRMFSNFDLNTIFRGQQVTVNINGVTQPAATVTTTVIKTTSDSTATSTGGQPLVAGPSRNRPISAY